LRYAARRFVLRLRLKAALGAAPAVPRQQKTRRKKTARAMKLYDSAPATLPRGDYSIDGASAIIHGVPRVLYEWRQ
jgi:hypothetical protein